MLDLKNNGKKRKWMKIERFLKILKQDKCQNHVKMGEVRRNLNNKIRR